MSEFFKKIDIFAMRGLQLGLDLGRDWENRYRWRDESKSDLGDCFRRFAVLGGRVGQSLAGGCSGGQAFAGRIGAGGERAAL